MLKLANNQMKPWSTVRWKNYSRGHHLAIVCHQWCELAAMVTMVEIIEEDKKSAIAMRENVGSPITQGFIGI